MNYYTCAHHLSIKPCHAMKNSVSILLFGVIIIFLSACQSINPTTSVMIGTHSSITN
ncbi:MAG: hypothetical protein Q4C68_07500 [Moraxella sp.]|nr:hypothetical protein [Moraxella sp.]